MYFYNSDFLCINVVLATLQLSMHKLSIYCISYSSIACLRLLTKIYHFLKGQKHAAFNIFSVHAQHHQNSKIFCQECFDTGILKKLRTSGPKSIQTIWNRGARDTYSPLFQYNSMLHYFYPFWRRNHKRQLSIRSCSKALKVML